MYLIYLDIIMSRYLLQNITKNLLDFYTKVWYILCMVQEYSLIEYLAIQQGSTPEPPMTRL